MTADVNPQPGDAAKLHDLIESIRIGVLTSIDRAGQLHARPLQTLQVERVDALWFFTDWSSPKVEELYRDRRVSMAYANVSKHTFVTVGGTASLLRDARKAQEIWSPEQRAFYPNGPGDQRLALLRVAIERAEYWIAPGPASYMISAARAAVTGTAETIVGENKKVK